jgi:hypothetical protein
MTTWIRELAGWILVLAGLAVFLLVYEYCERRWIFEAGILTLVGVIVFRGGILLLKVAIAARVCRQTQDQIYPARLAKAEPRPPLNSRRPMTEP